MNSSFSENFSNSFDLKYNIEKISKIQELFENFADFIDFNSKHEYLYQKSDAGNIA